MDSSTRRDHAMGVLLNRLGDADLNDTLDRIAALDAPALFRDNLQNFLDYRAQSDPAEVLRVLKALPDDLIGDSIDYEAFKALAARNLDGALDAFAEIRDPGFQQRARRGL